MTSLVPPLHMHPSPRFSLSSSLTQSPLSCCWSQSRAVWGGSVGCGCGLWCCGAGWAPERYTEASCARRSSSGPPSQSHPSPSAPAPLHAQPRLCWNCMPMGGPLLPSWGQWWSLRPWRCPGTCHLALSLPCVPGRWPRVLAACYCGCDHECESCESCERYGQCGHGCL